MQKHFLDIITNTGIATAFYTPQGCGSWNWEEPEARRNYEELAEDLGLSCLDMVRTKQTHTACVKTVGRENGGEGVCKEFGTLGFDGMVTNTKGLLLCTLEADCVPVYFLDPVKRAVGMVHSGWRGTAGKISGEAVKLMEGCYGSRAEDLLVCIGPHICSSCYEVSDDLWEPFAKKFNVAAMHTIFQPGKPGKYYLDLQKAIFVTLESLGVKPAKMHAAPHCTYHEDICDSFRKNGGQSLRMLTGIMLNK